MKRDTPLVSVIVPTYNVDLYIKKCLDSLQAQTLGDLEFLCIDDGSTDASGQILDEYAARDKRFKVVHQKNQGAHETSGWTWRKVNGWLSWILMTFTQLPTRCR